MAAEAEVERLIVKLMGDGSSYQRMVAQANAATTGMAGIMQRAGAAVTALGATVRNVGMGMRRLGRTMTTFVTAPLLLMAGASVFAFSNFDKAMTESTSIMDVTTRQIEDMREAALDLSASGELLQGPKDLAKAYFFLASAGKNAEQAMALLPKVSAFATAGAFDMALATDLLTDAQSALGLTMEDTIADAEQLARVGDVLVKANTLANASVQQFATSLTSKAGAALKSFGKEVEEGIAVLAALADQGIKAELAGNALDRVLRLSAKSALDNAAAHARLGFSVFDSSGAMRNMADIVGNLEDILGGLSTQQKVATLDMLGFEARVQGVILPLIGTSKAIREYEAELKKAKGITQEIAEKQMKSFANQMIVMKNQITVVAISIGKVLAPMLLRLNTFLKSGVEAWRSLDPAVQRGIVVAGLMVAAIGPLLVVLGTLTVGLGFVITALGTIVGLVGSAISIFAAFWPIILLGAAAATAAVAAMIVTWAVFGDAIKGAITSAWPIVRDFFVKVAGFVWNIRANWELFSGWFKRNWQNLLVDAGKLTVSFITNFGHNLGVVTGLGIKLFIMLGNSINKWLTWGVASILPALSKTLVKAGDLVLEWGKRASKLIAKALTGALVGGAAGALFSENFKKGMAKSLATGNLAEPLEEGFGDAIEQAWKDLKLTQGIDFRTEALPNWVTDLPDLFGEGLKEGLKDGLEGGVKEAVAAVNAADIPPVRVPVQLTTVEAVDVGSIEDMLLLSKIPTMTVPRVNEPNDRRGVIAAMAENNRNQRRQEAVVATDIVRTRQARANILGQPGGGVQEMTFVSKEMESILERIAESTRETADNQLEVVEADL